MKNLLLDTHIFIAALLYPEKFSRDIFDTIVNADHCYFSVITLIEILNLKRKNSLNMPFTTQQIIHSALNDHNFDLIDIEAQDIVTLENLPFLEKHKDPNDRMLIAQAISRNLTIVSADRWFEKYDVDLLKSRPI